MADPLLHRWQVGEISVVRVASDDFALPADRPLPPWCVGDLCPSAGEVGIAFSALAVAASGTRIVVDPWLANDDPRERPDAADRAAAVLGRLADAGFDPDDVDVVVNTHLDGVGWNTRPDGHGGWQLSFPNARYVYPHDEVRAIERGEPIMEGDGFEVLASLTAIESVVAPMVLAEGVSLVDAPGHNFGHLAVRIESGDDLAIYPGHLVLTPFDIIDPDEPPPGGHGAELAAPTRGRILAELAHRQGILLTTLLGGSGGGRVAPGGGGGYQLVG
mgnify:CR=1 FL=1